MAIRYNCCDKKLSLRVFLAPMLLISLVLFFLYLNNAFAANKYVDFQKDIFLFVNSKLSQFPSLFYNLTQIGDAFVAISMLSVCIVYASKIWKNVITASLVSLIFARTLKEIFDVPRPAQILERDSFSIIGETLVGFSSLPSGHSITIFTIFTVLLFGFMPSKIFHRLLWLFLIIFAGGFIAISRVAVGAHFPFDVIIGGIIGYVSGVTGILINQRYDIWKWMSNPKFYPFFIVLLLGSLVLIIQKIIEENLIIHYIAFAILLFSLYKIIDAYVKFKKQNS